MMHEYALIGVHTTRDSGWSALPIEKVSGRNLIRGYRAPVMRTVEIMSYHFTALSTVSLVILMMLVAKKEVTKDTTIPVAVIMRGNIMEFSVLMRS